jgi:hypothetical protein
MTKGACIYENDVSIVVAKNYSVAHCSWIAFRGSVKLSLIKSTGWVDQKEGLLGRGGKEEGDSG